MAKYKNKIIAAAITVIVLIFTFWWGGDSPTSHSRKEKETDTTLETNQETQTAQSEILEHFTQTSMTVVTTEDNKLLSNDKITSESTEISTEIITESVQSIKPEEQKIEQTSEQKTEQPFEQTTEIQSTVNEKLNDETAAEQTEQKDTDIDKDTLMCTLSVRCDTVLDNIDWLDKNKIEILPNNGAVFDEQTVVFYEGESVFNLLLREMKKNKIHLEFSNTPIYNSVYIEGIGNLYEFDCGELSGWKYKVNDIFPSCSCSEYLLKSGDKVEWVYTCDMGADVGAYVENKQ